MYSETFRLNVWDSKYISSSIQIILEILMHLLRIELQLKDNCPFDTYKVSGKYLKMQFLKQWDAMDWIKTMCTKKLKEKKCIR